MAPLSERRIARVVGAIGIILAAALLVGAFVNLYLVQNNDVRLCFIGGYTSAFSLSVGLFKNAKRAELFASTAV